MIRGSDNVQRHFWIRLILILLIGTGGLRSYSQVSTEGTDFWFGFLQNNDANQPSSLEIFITSRQAASGTITLMRDGTSQNFSVSPGVTYRYVVAESTNNPFAASGSGNVQNLGIHITSNENVSVYAFNKRRLSADATVILPTPTLGNNYIVASYYEESGQQNIESEFLIVGTEDGTDIEINPSVATVDGKAAGIPFSITLNRGETYQIQANSDLTGTSITSTSNDPNECKNFAVFGGNKWTRIGNCGGANDQLYEQLYPINAWGENYIVIPFLGRNSNGDLYRVIASEPNTRVTIDDGTGGPTVTTLAQAGRYVTNNADQATLISSDKPIQVVQYSKSQCAEVNANNNSPGDPFMLVVSPNEQLLNEVTFNTLNSDVIDNYYTTIITTTTNRDEVTLNGATINASDWVTLGSNPFYSYARVGLAGNRDYTLIAPDGFISYVYGFGVIESFGYAAGASLENLNLQVEGDDETIGIIVDEACLNSEIEFTVNFDTPVGQEPRFDSFLWDFGDGNVAEGIQVLHTYEEAGTYEIILIASDGSGACSTSETIIKEVTITEATINELLGPSSVCPDVTGVVYSVEGSDDNTYHWSVFGGTLATGGTGTEITVDWGEARDDAFVKVVPINYLGCIGDTTTINVRINKRLEPADPHGPSDVCFLDFAAVEYSTPITNGSEYEWFVIGGTIISANNRNQVTVSWDGPGITGEIWYREYNPGISDCEGFSEHLEVIVHPEIIDTPAILDASCNGEATGEISLSLFGGAGQYTVEWSNGQSGLTATNLVAGNYTATITDVLGCQIQREYVVNEPSVLEVVDFEILDVRCFQESNGEITITVNGGTSPYQYSFSGPNGFSQNTTVGFVDGMPRGDYLLQVTDANNCITELEFFVAEPPLLEPDLEQLINAPICPQATNGIVEIDAKGGTPSYQFFWNTAPPQEGMQATGLSRGEYEVRIVDMNGCETFLTVEVTERFPRIFMPSAFSPNGDGQNDRFVPTTDCDLNFNMQIFNKWGTIIYSSDDIAEGWDGTYEGKDVPDGPYVYRVFYAGSINEVPFEETINGTVRILR